MSLTSGHRLRRERSLNIKRKHWDKKRKETGNFRAHWKSCEKHRRFSWLPEIAILLSPPTSEPAFLRTPELTFPDGLSRPVNRGSCHFPSRAVNRDTAAPYLLLTRPFREWGGVHFDRYRCPSLQEMSCQLPTSTASDGTLPFYRTSLHRLPGS